MSEEELASFQASAQNIREMIQKSALGGNSDPFHSDIYLNVHDAGAVTVIGGSPGDITQSYGTFTEPYLDDINSSQEDGTQAIVNVADFIVYGLDFASDGGELQVSLRGDPDEELVEAIEFYGAVNSRIMTSVAGDVLEEVATGIIDHFPDGGAEYHSTDKEGNPPFPTHIRVDAEQIQRLIEVVNHQNPSNPLYPITVEDGELTLDIGRDEGRNAVWGELEANSVEGQDVDNTYKKGFEEVFGSFSGEVWLQTAPNGPLTAAQDGQDGVIIRHNMGNMG